MRRTPPGPRGRAVSSCAGGGSRSNDAPRSRYTQGRPHASTMPSNPQLPPAFHFRCPQPRSTTESPLALKICRISRCREPMEREPWGSSAPACEDCRRFSSPLYPRLPLLAVDPPRSTTVTALDRTHKKASILLAPTPTVRAEHATPVLADFALRHVCLLFPLLNFSMSQVA